MKRTMIAALASLMLAGALGAVSGASAVSSSGVVLVAGDGAAPAPTILPQAAVSTDATSLTNNF